MKTILDEPRFDFITGDDRDFILAFNDEMTHLGYDFGGKIGSGYCWGNYMLIYRKTNIKSERVYARIYIREPRVVLRLFLNDIDRHRKYLENTPAYIQEVFTGPQADCQHCHNEKHGACRFRKTYMLDGRLIEKCNGITFEFHEPTTQKLGDYINLFIEFYPSRKKEDNNIYIL
jgi:hypothetical protein